MRVRPEVRSDESRTLAGHHVMVGYAKVSEVVAATFFTVLIFGFYLAHYALSTGFFTIEFTPLLAVLFFMSVLYTIFNSSAKAVTPRKDIVAFVELAGAVLFTTVAAWFFFAFPLKFAHLTDIVPVSIRFMFSWINDDIGRIIVALALIGGVISIVVDSVKLVWRVTVRRFSQAREM